ncbi:hypothetical protein Prudu_993S000100, partial [Prunus dulcis]
APGVQLIHRRDLREVQLARTSRETLPNFRQKSEKKKKKGKATLPPSSRSRRHHRATRSPAPVPSEPQLARRHFPTNSSPAHAGSWPESAIFAVGRVRTFSSNISPISSPNLSSEAPGVRLIHRRDPREVQLARTSSRRRTKETTRAIILAPDPPPKCRISLGDSAEFSAEVGRKPKISN